MVKTRSNRVTNTSYLPSELVSEVLARLPAKTLLKFRCVCKEWKSLIENPNFVSLHLHLFKNNRELNQLLVIERNRHMRWKVFASVRCAETFRRAYQIRVKFQDDWPRNFRIEGYASGLLLWKTFDSAGERVSGFMLWNPSIRKSMEIQIPANSAFSKHSWVGLGFDSLVNNCKVVFVSVLRHPQSQQSTVPIVVHIYSVTGRVWRSSSVDARILRCRGYYNTSTFLNGAIHWIGYDVSIVPRPSNGSHVLVFDLHNEVFKSFQLPSERNVDASSVLAVVGESLALLDFDHLLGHFNVWVMEQYGVAESWVKRCTIDLEQCDELLYFKRNGELLVTMRRQVKAYEIESAKIKDLARSYKEIVLFMDTFVESLLLLN